MASEPQRPRRYQDFRRELEGGLKAEFEDKIPLFWGPLQGRPRDIERARAILDHTDQAVRELWADYRETRSVRVAEESLAIWEARVTPAAELGTPFDSCLLSGGSILREARQRVRLRHEGLITAVQRNGEDAVWAVAKGRRPPSTTPLEEKGRTMSEIEREKHFKAELHEAIDTAQAARTQARRLFANAREELIAEARANGSENPERDAGRAQAQILKDIDRQEHKDIHAVFEKHGWSREFQEVTFSKGEGAPAREIDQSKLQEFKNKLSGITQEHAETGQSAQDQTASSQGEAQSQDKNHDHEH